MYRGRVPHITEMQQEDIQAVLARNYVGRIAYSLHDRVDIQPIHYVYSDGWIYGRTSPGTKLNTIRHNYWVAFEVDEVTSMFEWRSVVVHGGFYTLSPTGSEEERTEWQKAVDLLRRLLRQTLTEADPVPSRTVVFRIAVQEVTGRASRLVAAPHREESDNEANWTEAR